MIATALYGHWGMCGIRAKKLYQSHNIGYGVLSMQGKEAKHSQIKQELKNC